MIRCCDCSLLSFFEGIVLLRGTPSVHVSKSETMNIGGEGKFVVVMQKSDFLLPEPWLDAFCLWRQPRIRRTKFCYVQGVTHRIFFLSDRIF